MFRFNRPGPQGPPANLRVQENRRKRRRLTVRPLAVIALALSLSAIGFMTTRSSDALAASAQVPVCRGVPQTALGAKLFAKQPLYVALGDSLAVGTGATHPVFGYVPRTWANLVQANHKLIWLVNCGESGAKSADLVQRQLPEAVALIAARHSDLDPSNDVVAITVDIGGNDARTLIESCAGGLNPPTNACVLAIQQTFSTFAANLTATLAQLRQAAPNTPIAVMTLFNSLDHPQCKFNSLAPAGDVVLEGGGPLQAGLNDVIRQVAAAFGASVAETFGKLGPDDLRDDCIHPDDSGYTEITRAYEAALGL